MAFFMGMSTTIRRNALTELLEIVLKPRGHAAGRGKPIYEFVEIPSRG